MKKKLAYLLAMSLFFGSISPAYAMEADFGSGSSEGIIQDVSSQENPDALAEETGGQYDVEQDIQDQSGTQPEDAAPGMEGDLSAGASEDIQIPGDTDPALTDGEANPDPTEGEDPGLANGTLDPALDGEVPDGDALDGETLDGDALDGETLDGETLDGDALDLTEDGEEPTDGETTEPPVVSGATGQVSVQIGLTMPGTTSFTVELSQGETVRSQAVTLNGSSLDQTQGTAVFEELAAGTYTLSVKAAGYATYTQQIAVEALTAHKVQVFTGFLAGEWYTYEAGKNHPGVLLLGDVDGDGAITDVDKDLMIDYVDEQAPADYHPGHHYDLDGNGVADLVDLDYFVNSYMVQEDTQSTVSKEISAKAILPKVDESTTIAGAETPEAAAAALESLLKQESTVALQPAAPEAPISAENPVSVSFDFQTDEEQNTAPEVQQIVVGTAAAEITEATIDVTYFDPDTQQDVTVQVSYREGVHALSLDDATVTKNPDGSLDINLGKQVAVKRVTLKIEGMENNSNLAEISKVEFVNNMEDRIPEPELGIPENLVLTAGSKEFTAEWDPVVNVTGFEVLITDKDGKTELRTASANTLTVTTFDGKELVNYSTYKVKVRSINGTWRSDYCAEGTVTPKPTAKPEKPDNVTATGRYKSISVSWKDMKDTMTYNLYYKETEAEGEPTVIKEITSNSYTLLDLKELTSYTIYVTGVNEFGESDHSMSVEAKTTDLNPAQVPKYGLINYSETEGEPSKKIINATRSGGRMDDSPKDTGTTNTAWGVVDNNPASQYIKETWDDGGFNNLGSNGFTIEFDQEYEIDTITLINTTTSDYFYGKVRWWDKDDKQVGETVTYQISVSRLKDAEGRQYTMLKLPEVIKAKKIQVGIALYMPWSGNVVISEAYFYRMDEIMEKIMDLYADDLHTVLKDDVDIDDIEALRKEVNTPDPVTKELHPNQQALLNELQTAEDILNSKNLSPSVEIYNTITTSDDSRGFGGLNAWQPLGVVAAAGEDVTIYVGHNTKKTNDNTNLQLVVTQYHAESSAMFEVVKTLKVGQNVVTIPKVWKTTGYESGGALYVQYTGNNSNDHYAVRVNGGVQIPRLDLYQVSTEAEKLQRATEFVTAMETYVSEMESKHKEVHLNSENKEVQYPYDVKNCILGAADILLDTMLLSLPAQQILAGAGTGDTAAKAQRIVTSMNAVEEMMYLFYQHKGLNNNAAASVDRFPKQHQNIRYQRMFAGAFMYASGNHIGIEYTETDDLIGGNPIVATEDGQYISGNYFGWGIAHEVGHCINQDTYAIAEITNNYFSVLAQADETNKSVRFEYPNVYEKVTSGTKGASSNVFTQLGMYWQLHLAYDKGLNYKTYSDHATQLENLFFARVDSYARTPANAPTAGENGIALTLVKDREQDLMRLACAAAQKNLLEFFERWGKTPNEETIAYANQFEKETRAIYYVNDEARLYSLTHSGGTLNPDGSTPAVSDDTKVTVDPNSPKRMNFTLGTTLDQDQVLGYEIVRTMISAGKVERETAGFTTENTFTDYIPTMNNRVITYEVTVVDKYLNRSAVKVLDPVKLGDDGSLDKTYWTVTEEGIEGIEGPEPDPADEDDPCDPEPIDPATQLIDSKIDTVYTALTGENNELILEFNKKQVICGFKITLGGEYKDIVDAPYTLYIRDGETWTEILSGTMNKDETIYFENPEGKFVSTYSGTALKLVFKEMSFLSIAELDALGVTGDNVDFLKVPGEEDVPAIGKLAADFTYGKEPEDVIPKDSIVFTGSYKGNAAYNVVILYDQDGNIVGGKEAYQIILSEIPNTGFIQDTTDGRWIYWIDPSDVDALSKVQKVRAELYRVNNAHTNEGQRLVSDSMFETMPPIEELPLVTFSSSTNQG